MAVSVGLEITENRVNVVVLEGSAKAVRLRLAFSEEFGNPPEGTQEREFRAARLGEIFKKYHIPRSNIVCSLPVQDVFAREVVVPFVKEDQIRKTIKFEAEEYLPGTRADDTVVDFYKIGQVAQKSRVLVFAARKEKIHEFLALLGASAIEPAATGLDAAYLFHTALACGVLPATDHSPAPSQTQQGETCAQPVKENESLPPATVIASLSEDRVCLILTEGDRLRRMRGFRLGQTEKAAEKLVREINRTLAAVPGLSRIEKVYISGSCATDALASELTEMLGTDSSVLDLSCIFKGGLTEGQRAQLSQGGSVALGSGLAGLGQEQVKIDFRRDEFAYQKAFDRLKTGLACTLCLLFFICFLLCYSFHFKLSQDKRLLSLQRSLAQGIFKTVAPDKKTPGEDISSIEQSYADLLKVLKLGKGSEKAPAIISSLDLLNEIASLIPAQIDVRLVDCSIDQTGVRLDAIVPTEEEKGALSAAIDRQGTYLITESSGGSASSKDGKWQANYRFGLRQKQTKKQ
jgi:hypothetical protein